MKLERDCFEYFEIFLYTFICLKTDNIIKNVMIWQVIYNSNFRELEEIKIHIKFITIIKYISNN